MKQILITGGNPATGELDLSDHGDTKARIGEKIKWKIVNDAVVKSIVSIQLKANTTDIFSGRNGKHPEKVDNKNWKADIADDARLNDVCEYSITWNDGSGGPPPTHDPKISINASVNYLAWVISLILVFLGLSLVYWRMKRMKKRNTQ